MEEPRGTGGAGSAAAAAAAASSWRHADAGFWQHADAGSWRHADAGRRYLARPDPSCGGGRQRGAPDSPPDLRVVAADVVAAAEADGATPTGSRGEEEAGAWWRDY
ncbi:Os03g0584500 [Oryza sativa Japonica Group]|uniref:Os03g0584500 protein n=3 Tax=Oryza TaxID=4527 RepID=Q10HK7_ORYSJ|nr:hypothetical protein LOC_Os03g38804 [Oryza sativa Japonica Group]EAZ27625.1 hypothetical protein OsJ_11569 [Oryza sativa Japonica Group]BAS85087.1 Os03g0584500 [Oryza sativa Japonica Group]